MVHSSCTFLQSKVLEREGEGEGEGEYVPDKVEVEEGRPLCSS